MWCCEDTYTYTVNKTIITPEYQAYKDAVAAFMADEFGQCFRFSDGSGGLKVRSMNETNDFIPSTSLHSRAVSITKTPRNSMIGLLYTLLSNYEAATNWLADLQILCKSINFTICFSTCSTDFFYYIGDTQVGGSYSYLYLHFIKVYLASSAAWKTVDYEYLSEQIPCNLEEFNLAVQQFYSTPNTTEAPCDQWSILIAQPDFFEGDQDWIDSQGPSNVKRDDTVVTLDHLMDREEKMHFLEKRDGGERNFTVNLGTDANGQPIFIIVTSWTYPNGNNGEAWVTATGIRVHYTLDTTSCATATYIETVDPEAVPGWAGTYFTITPPTNLKSFEPNML